jgi:hypothetical protein
MDTIFVFGVRLRSAEDLAAALIQSGLPADPVFHDELGDQVTVARPTERVFIEWYGAIPEHFEAPQGASAPCVFVHYREAYLGLLAEVLEVLAPLGQIVDNGFDEALEPSVFLARMRTDPGWWYLKNHMAEPPA